jgi:hypothetical protein
LSKIRRDIHKSRCTTGINDTGGEFATDVNHTGSKIVASINNTGGKFFHQFSLVLLISVANLPAVSTTPVANLPPVATNGNNYQTADNLK